MTPKKKLRLEKKLEKLKAKKAGLESKMLDAMFAKTFASSLTILPLAIISILSLLGISVGVFFSKYRNVFIIGVVAIIVILVLIPLYKNSIRPSLMEKRIIKLEKKLNNMP